MTLVTDLRYIDLESSLFKVDGEKAGDWHKTYCKVAEDLSKQGYTVFVSSHSAVVEALRGSQEIVAVVYPSIKLQDEWIAKLKERYLGSLSDKDLRAYNRACQHYADDVAALRSCNKVYRICLKTMNYNLEEMLTYFSSKAKKVEPIWSYFMVCGGECVGVVSR